MNHWLLNPRRKIFCYPIEDIKIISTESCMVVMNSDAAVPTWSRMAYYETGNKYPTKTCGTLWFQRSATTVTSLITT